MVSDKHLNLSLSNYRAHEIEILDAYVSQLAKMEQPELVMTNFPRFTRTQEITRFLVMYELFKNILDVHGSIIEMGVLEGFNVFSLAHFSEMFEPRNYTRKIIGFDTFSGYPSTDPAKDRVTLDDENVNFCSTHSYEMLEESVKLFNRSIAFNQFEKICLVKGDAEDTIPTYVADHPELVVSMLICHCDVYKPTKTALEYFFPLMPKGGLIFFGTLNYEPTPGETAALKEIIPMDQVRLKRFPFATKTSYMGKE